MIEVLLSLTVLFICAVILTGQLPILKTDSPVSRQEIQLFFQQLKDDMDFAYRVEAIHNGIVLKEKYYEREYVQSQDKIIRRKNGTGYEIVLQNIKGFSAELTPYGADVTIIDDNGVSWSGVLGKRAALEGGKDFWVKRDP